jgi:hypothetical protein
LEQDKKDMEAGYNRRLDAAKTVLGEDYELDLASKDKELE